MCSIYRILAEESQLQKRSPTAILFEEWGTSGRKRATVHDLMELLIKIDLFRAAECVAGILKESPPVRPEYGPGARINIDLPDMEINSKEIEVILDNVQYPNSTAFLSNNASTIHNNNRDYNPDVSIKNHVKVKKNYFLGSEEELSSSNENQSDVDLPASDLMKFSKSSVLYDRHIIDDMNESSQEHIDASQYLPQLTSLANSSIGLPLGLSHLENDAYPNSSVLQMSVQELANTISNAELDASGALNSFLLPDIDNLQIREQVISYSMSNSNESMSSSMNNDSTAESIQLRNDSVYIPNLSLLNQS